MKFISCNTPAEELVADCFQEWSLAEHNGIKNVLILAITGCNEIVLGALCSDETEQLNRMLDYARGYVMGREEIDEEIMRMIANDEIPEADGYGAE